MKAIIKAMKRTMIFGAKATAAGLYKALQGLEPDKRVEAFVVSGSVGREDPEEIWGCPVKLLKDVAGGISDSDKQGITVYAAVPELIHPEIERLLNEYGFTDIAMLDSRREADIMGRFFEKEGRFRSVHTLPLPFISASNIGDFSTAGIGDREFSISGIEGFSASRIKGFPSFGNEGFSTTGIKECFTSGISDSFAEGIFNTLPEVTIYSASFYKDKPLKNPPVLPGYVKKLYLGCALAREQGIDITGMADFYDDTGDNISLKNPNRCEMTAHYWVWKNRLNIWQDEYVGICHYRRLLDLSDEDLIKIRENDIDVVLPFPMIHYPDAGIHHTWYVPEKDWRTLKEVVKELQPEYAERFQEVFSQPYFYNYNMLLAKKQVFADYCEWLYPILDRIEEVSTPPGSERADRYTAYMSESLETLYFMVNRDRLKIRHTGRLLYT